MCFNERIEERSDLFVGDIGKLGCRFRVQKRYVKFILLSELRVIPDNFSRERFEKSRIKRQPDRALLILAIGNPDAHAFFRATAALMNALNKGCGERGRAFISGWNCVPSMKGCSSLGSSAISLSFPSCHLPEKTSPAFSSWSTYLG